MEHTFAYSLVARALRLYPVNFTYCPGIRVEFFGHYLARGFCPEIVSKTRERNCTGKGECGVPNMHCAVDPLITQVMVIPLLRLSFGGKFDDKLLTFLSVQC